MDSKDIIQKLKSSINQLRTQSLPSLEVSELITLEFGEKEAHLITKIVIYFNEILSHKYIKKNQKSPKLKLNKNNYWTFIANHFNNPLIDFCRIYDKNEMSNNIKGVNFILKGEIWIFLSILEKSFTEIINEIYKLKLDEKFYEENSFLRKYKEDIKKIVKELKNFNFINIKNKDFEQYQDYLEKNHLFNNNNIINTNSINQTSPILNNETQTILSYSDIPLVDLDNSQSIIHNFSTSIKTLEVIKDEKEFMIIKYKDFLPSIMNDFYTFNNNNNFFQYDNKFYMFDNNNNSINIDIDNLSNITEHSNKTIILELNPKKSNFLPTDNLYETNEKNDKEYNQNDIIIYKKKVRQVSNCLLLYLNKYYKKAPFHKFYKHNLHNKPITLKEQNYQCFICYKKFSLFLNIPTEPIFWCSYYMRFICKDCIDTDYSIIPYFVLQKWCFQKFSISKKAKNILINWYNKPIIYFRNNDGLLYKVKQLNKVIEIKKVINNIFDIMKCKNRFKFVEDNLGEYQHIALKEYLFSMKDLVEINNKTFYKKIIEFKNKFVKHISGECPDCKFEGQICEKCLKNEKIFFYDYENVYYCKKCRKSFHKKCIIIGHIH